MKHISKLAALSIVLGTLFISTAASAQVNAKASVSDTSFQLIDLDLNDGISSSISFSNISNSSSANIFSGTFSDGFNSSASRNASSNRATAVFVGDANAGASSSYAGGIFGELASSGQTNEQGSFNTNQSYNTIFTLTPKTLLVFFGKLSGSAVNSSSNFFDSSSSNTSIFLSGNLTPSGAGFQSSSISESASSFSFQNQFEKSFTLSFINGNSAELSGNFSASTSVFGSNSSTFVAAAVPEPETYAMMLAGLALMAAVARRRSRTTLG